MALIGKTTNFKFLSNAVCLLLLTVVLLPKNLASAPDVEVWERSIVRVLNQSNGGFGTGWLVSGDGIIATNHHVVNRGQNFKVFLAGTTQADGIPAKLLWSDARLDLAVLQVPGFAAEPFKLFTNDPVRGSVAYTAGYPGMADAAAQGISFQISIYSGTVSLVVEQEQRARRTIQHDTIVNAGNSGGPLLDACGRVLGVTSEGYADQDVNVVWLSVHVAELAKQLDRLNISYAVDNSTCDTATVVNVPTADEEARLAAQNANTTAQDAQLEVESLEDKMFRWGVILAAGLAILLVLVLRNPRAKMVKAIEGVTQTISRSNRTHESPPAQAQGLKQNIIKTIVFSGFSSSGKTIRIEFSLARLEGAGKGISIGRSTIISDYGLDDKEVSRRHARVSARNGEIFIEDLNSTNGTKVNEQVLSPFVPKLIADGDVVKIGQLELTVGRSV